MSKPNLAEKAIETLESRNEKKIASGIAGVAGEYFVAAELSRRGYLTTLTQRNSKGVDVLVTNGDATKSAAIQVKTNQGHQNHWILTNKAEKLSAPRLFYVFVNLGGRTGRPEFYVVPSAVVADYVTNSHREWLRTPGKKGRPHQDNSMRKFIITSGEYLNRWNSLDLD